VLDGLDCVRQFREWEVKNRPNQHQYIVGISAHASMHDFQMGMKRGMDHFLSKPITIEALTTLEINSPTAKIAFSCIRTLSSTRSSTRDRYELL
jgi:CheY-like chemotaxis protein